MKTLSEKKALERLHKVKSEFAARILTVYEHRAKDCATCETKGACCLDAHFVNVHITRLDAAAIWQTIGALSTEKQSEVFERVEQTISKYRLSESGDTFAKTYACPLFEKGIGCLVHERGKPLPCIAHACYENKADLPPDDLLAEQEARVEKLNERAYRQPAAFVSLPVAIKRYSPERPLTSQAITNPANSHPTT